MVCALAVVVGTTEAISLETQANIEVEQATGPLKPGPKKTGHIEPKPVVAVD